MTDLLASFQIAYVADIVCALILLIFAAGGAKKGFVKCFFGLISTLVALILAITLASTVAGWLPSLFGSEGFFAGKFEGTLFIICAILAILSLIPSEGIVSFFDKTLVLKYIYNKNPLTMLLGLFIKF